MINDSILNELWAVIEENPDNPVQLLVIADRYMEIHYGLEKFANALRWLVNFNRHPLKFTNSIGVHYQWEVRSFGSQTDWQRNNFIPFGISFSANTCRESYEVIGVCFAHLDGKQISMLNNNLEEELRNNIGPYPSEKPNLYQIIQDLLSDITEPHVRNAIGFGVV